ncbi:isochorismate synthase MenF [Lentzea sp. NPDC058436]|uniref:isochorismate synthase n=1 Tax=Lentzea sp. NPDC058436 TaxID=3346499 RepID=UPI003663E50B
MSSKLGALGGNDFFHRCAAAHAAAVASGSPVLVSARLRGGVPEDPGDLRARAPRTFHWRSSWTGRSMLGLGTAADLPATGPDRFARLAAGVRGLCATGEEPVLVGGFSFHAREERSHWLPDCLFWVPEALWQRDEKGRAFWTLSTVVRPEEDPAHAAVRALRWLRPGSGARAPVAGSTPLHVDEGAGRAEWDRLVGQALDAIGAGVLDKVVTARALPVSAPRPFHVPRLLARLEAGCREGAVFAVRDRERWFVGATPERLLSRRDDEITTVGLAGSAPRSVDPAADAELGRALFSDDKIRREHDYTAAYLVDRIASRCTGVQVAGPELTALPTVQHLRTRVRATAPAGPGAFLDLLADLHPTPAVGGVPPDRAAAWLADAESFDRGWYAGGVGWLRPSGDGEIGLAIRSAEVSGNTALVYAGCGVVAGSTAAREWQETRWKTRPMLSALAESVLAESERRARVLAPTR